MSAFSDSKLRFGPSTRASIIGLAVILLLSNDAIAQSRKINLDSILNKAIVRHDLPAMGAAIILDGEVSQTSVTGLRKYGGQKRVLLDDAWHLGSDSKAMTASLIGRLVDAGKMRWDMTVGETFPELQGKMDSGYRTVTVEMLLCHFGGLPEETCPPGTSLPALARLPGSPREQRYSYVGLMLKQPPRSRPGTLYEYSNAGVSIAGAMAERVMDQSYEELMKFYIFRPLGITTAGFGPMNTPGKEDAPWQHIVDDGTHLAIDNDSTSDNPPAITPAGRIHMSIGDWAEFGVAHLDTASGFFSSTTFRHLHSLPFGGEYGFGWGIIKRPWAKGEVLTHDGSNTQNYATIWLAPKLKFGVMVATNEGGDEAAAACSEVVDAVVMRLYIKK